MTRRYGNGDSVEVARIKEMLWRNYLQTLERKLKKNTESVHLRARHSKRRSKVVPIRKASSEAK